VHLSNFTAFGLFFDNVRSFWLYNRFLITAISVACNDGLVFGILRFETESLSHALFERVAVKATL
jgi:hypothetical protein